jgi:hypothetical protein
MRVALDSRCRRAPQRRQFFGMALSIFRTVLSGVSHGPNTHILGDRWQAAAEQCGAHERGAVEGYPNKPAQFVGAVPRRRGTSRQQVYASLWQSDTNRVYLAIWSRLPAPKLLATVCMVVTSRLDGSGR